MHVLPASAVGNSAATVSRQAGTPVQGQGDGGAFQRVLDGVTETTTPGARTEDTTSKRHRSAIDSKQATIKHQDDDVIDDSGDDDVVAQEASAQLMTDVVPVVDNSLSGLVAANNDGSLGAEEPSDGDGVALSADEGLGPSDVAHRSLPNEAADGASLPAGAVADGSGEAGTLHPPGIATGEEAGRARQTLYIPSEDGSSAEASGAGGTGLVVPAEMDGADTGLFGDDADRGKLTGTAHPFGEETLRAAANAHSRRTGGDNVAVSTAPSGPDGGDERLVSNVVSPADGASLAAAAEAGLSDGPEHEALGEGLGRTDADATLNSSAGQDADGAQRFSPKAGELAGRGEQSAADGQAEQGTFTGAGTAGQGATGSFDPSVRGDNGTAGGDDSAAFDGTGGLDDAGTVADVSSSANDAAGSAAMRESQIMTVDVDGVSESAPIAKPLAERMQEMVESIVRERRVGGMEQVAIRLHPEHLGRLLLRVGVDETGVVHARFIADNASVRSMIEQDLGSLRSALEEHGLVLGDAGVEAHVGSEGGADASAFAGDGQSHPSLHRADSFVHGPAEAATEQVDVADAHGDALSMTAIDIRV